MSYFKEKIIQASCQDSFKKQRNFADSLKKKSSDFSPKIECKIANTTSEKVAGITGREDLLYLFEEVLVATKDQKESAIMFVEKILEKDWTKEEKLEIGLRGATAILTNGVTTTPIEGVLDIERKVEGEADYVRLVFTGPIRAAGGTNILLIIAMAGYLKERLGIGDYHPTKEETERYITQIQMYMRIRPRPITPTTVELRFAIEHCPICIDGLATEEEEVTIHKYLPRVQTPRLRGGVALAVVDGLIMKAKKAKTYTDKLRLNWPWLKDLYLLGQKHRKGSKLASDYSNVSKFQLTMGRPLLSLEGQRGGLRYRIAKSSNNGLSAALINSLTFELIGFINIGSQAIMAGALPKAATLHANQDMCAPLVEYKNQIGRYRPDTRDKVLKILDLGEIGFALGEHIQYNYVLKQRDYCVEAWRSQSGLTEKPSDKNISLATPYKLHPDYSLFLRHILPGDYLSLRKQLLTNDYLSFSEDKLEIMRKLGAECSWTTSDRFHFKNPRTFKHHFLLDQEVNPLMLMQKGVQSYVNQLLKNEGRTPIGQKGTNYVSLRVGRAESVSYSRLKPPITGLAEYRSPKNQPFWNALRTRPGIYRKSLFRYCDGCQRSTYKILCDRCKDRTRSVAWCQTCQKNYGDRPELTHGAPSDRLKGQCPLSHQLTYKGSEYYDFEEEVEKLKEEGYPGIGVSFPRVTLSPSKSLSFFEPFAKVYLRSLHKLNVSRDGVTRLNMMNLTTTSFKPKDVRLSVEKAKILGYYVDRFGEPLQREDQELNLKVNDLLLPLVAFPGLKRQTLFLDQLIEYYYKGPKAYYSVEQPEDMIGVNYTVISPHTSCGYNSRIVGWVEAQGFYSHPVAVAARRRNLDGDGDLGALSMGIYLNYSRAFASDRVGSLMGSPVLLADQIHLPEVDDEAHVIQSEEVLPSFFLQNTRSYTPDEIKSNIKTYKQLGSDFEGTYDYRTPGALLSLGDTRNLYKDLGSSSRKFDSLLSLQDKLLVDNRDYYVGLLHGHLLRDLVGNANAYFRQSFLCEYCKEKYEYVPLKSQCIFCHNGKVRLTVTRSMVTKYVGFIKRLLKEDIPEDTRAKIDIVLDTVSCFNPPFNPLKAYLDPYNRP